MVVCAVQAGDRFSLVTFFGFPRGISSVVITGFFVVVVVVVVIVVVVVSCFFFVFFIVFFRVAHGKLVSSWV